MIAVDTNVLIYAIGVKRAWPNLPCWMLADKNN